MYDRIVCQTGKMQLPFNSFSWRRFNKERIFLHKVSFQILLTCFDTLFKNHVGRMYCFRKYPYPLHGRFIGCNPPPPSSPFRNSILASCFLLKYFTFETPVPLGTSSNLPWGVWILSGITQVCFSIKRTFSEINIWFMYFILIASLIVLLQRLIEMFTWNAQLKKKKLFLVVVFMV